MDASLSPAMLAAIPHLRAFAISLAGNIERADDLVQEALVRAMTHIDKFEPGTNMQAWLFTILRNQFHTEFRKRWREVEDPEGVLAGKLAVAPEQGARLDYEDMCTALSKLSADQREALVLVGAEGFTYDEAARICNTSIGTIKSRVNRARTRLSELLSLETPAEIGPDRLVRAVTYNSSIAA